MVHGKTVHIIFLYSCILLLSGCRQNTIEEYTDKNGNRVIREWYNKTRVKSIKTFTNHEGTNYHFVSFYRNGLIMDSATYIDGKIHGVRKFYEESSGLVHFENYENGLLNGPQKAVFSSGISSFEGYRKNNLKVGEWKFFYPDGKPITYEFYDSTGRLKYIKKYDKDGSIIKTDGNGLIEVQIDQISVNLQDPVSGYALIAMPEGCSFHFSITDVTSGSDRSPFFEDKKPAVRIQWKKIYEQPGEKRLLFTLVIIDDQSGEEERSFYEQVVYVNPD